MKLKIKIKIILTMTLYVGLSSLVAFIINARLTSLMTGGNHSSFFIGFVSGKIVIALIVPITYFLIRLYQTEEKFKPKKKLSYKPKKELCFYRRKRENAEEL